jgi:hypothetical protein
MNSSQIFLVGAKKMKVKGLNKLYDVKIKKIDFNGQKGVAITCGNLMTGMTSVVISEEDWKKIKERI